MGTIEPIAKSVFPADRALVFAGNEADRDLLGQVLRGAGFGTVAKAATVAELINLGHARVPDLVAIDCGPDGVGHDALCRIRACSDTGFRRVPVLIVATLFSKADVARSRDGGVNLLLSKPLSVRLMRERLAWLSRVDRSFVVSSSYVGPDRRHSAASLPDGVTLDRRATDATLLDGAVLSQEAVDSLFFVEG